MTKQRIILFLLLFVSTLPLRANYIVGTYNIRLSTTSDTGNLAWENRKQYVAQIISDHHMDFCGLNELKPDQKKDLTSLLPDYNIESWGRDSWQINGVGEGVGIAYRKDKFSKLDAGHFFLAPNVTRNTIAWDAKYRRLAVWIKLKDKSTGTVFYYCSTHLEQSGKVAKRKGAAVVVEQMKMIAGTTPCFIAGDFNAQESASEVHMPFLAYFSNAYSASITKPVGNGTYGGWAKTSTNRIDHIYTRGWRVLNYTTITDDFGRPVTPSDHLPVVIEAELTTGPKTIYYTQDKQQATSLQSIIDNASLGDTIDLQGQTISDYPLSVPQTLILCNGTLDNSPITISAPAALHVIDCHFKNAATAIKANGYALYAKHCTFTDCRSDQQGGALVVTGKMNLQQCTFSHNTALTSGGAVAFLGTLWDARINQCLFENNNSKSGAAVYVSGADDIAVRNSSFVFNTASENGAFTWQDQSSSTHIQLLNCTFAENKSTSVSSFKDNIRGGSSVYVYGDTATTLSLVHCTVVRDTNVCYTTTGEPSTIYKGAAVMARNIKVKLINNLILDNNTSATNSGDYYASEDVKELCEKNNLLTQGTTPTTILAKVTYQNDLAVIPLLEKIYAGISVCPLMANQLTETYFEEDIDDDGCYNSALQYDIIGQSRPDIFATLGALEYQERQGLPSSKIKHQTSSTKHFLPSGEFIIRYNDKTYSILGQTIQ